MESSAKPNFQDLIAEAVKAPSGHNTQPWRFRVLADGVEIRPDFSRALPVVDGDNRELFVSLGCAVENLCIAASHQELQAATSVDEAGVITINLRPGKVTPDPLLAQIDRRQTNRSLLEGSIPESDIQTLKQISPEPGAQFHIFDKNSPAFETITEFLLRGNSRQMNNAAFKNELKSWMRYNKKHQDETRDGLSYARCLARRICRVGSLRRRWR